MHKMSYFRITILLLIIMSLLAGCQIAPLPTSILVNEPIPKPIASIKVALVLGGGGSKSLAHLGVLEVLQKENISIDLIVGTSAGSIIGALYADSHDISYMKSKIMDLKKEDLLDIYYRDMLWTPISVIGPIRGLALQEFILKNLKARDFSELKTPLIAVATNLNDNSISLLRSGPIAPALNASSAIPPYFAPVKLYNKLLVDGGVMMPVPVQIAKQFNPNIIIAVDISSPPPQSKLNNTFELVKRALHITYYELSQLQSHQADVVIHPELEGFNTFDDQFNYEIYEAGKMAARKALPKIKQLIKNE
ncbi:MAG: hypothetical protein JWM09_747 [Francisellaceae bacterium]|nr:hypothetical protein [Francisellaceae bacterium]